MRKILKHFILFYTEPENPQVLESILLLQVTFYSQPVAKRTRTSNPK